MEIATLVLLAAIALLDATSIGTLVVPLWLMLDPRRSAANVVLYLATLSGFYFVTGLGLLRGAQVAFDAAGDRLAEFFTTTEGGYVLTAVGAALIVASVWMEPKRRQRAREARGLGPARPWAERASGQNLGAGGTIALAVGAGVVEIATMLPYLAAMGIITTLEVSRLVETGLLAGYVLIMAVPALVLLAVRAAAGERVTGRLQRIRAWLTKHSAGTISILLLILGINVVLRGLHLIQ